MQLLSIDVGIKNLAYCLMSKDAIIKWDVINLCGADPLCTICKKQAVEISMKLLTLSYCLAYN